MKFYQLLIACLIFLVACAQKTQNESTDSGAVEAGDDPTSTLVELEILETDYSIGSPEAPVTLIEFSDFQCPSCYDFYSMMEELKEDYIETGKVRFVFKNYPLDSHPQALRAAVAARCAGSQGKFWEMYSLLFENQDKLNKVTYIEFAKSLGLDQTEFEKCLDDPFVMRDVKVDKNEGRKIGVEGTPYFILNGEMYSGVPPKEVLIEMIETLL